MPYDHELFMQMTEPEKTVESNNIGTSDHEMFMKLTEPAKPQAVEGGTSDHSLFMKMTAPGESEEERINRIRNSAVGPQNIPGAKHVLDFLALFDKPSIWAAQTASKYVVPKEWQLPGTVERAKKGEYVEFGDVFGLEPAKSTDDWWTYLRRGAPRLALKMTLDPLNAIPVAGWAGKALGTAGRVGQLTRRATSPLVRAAAGSKLGRAWMTRAPEAFPLAKDVGMTGGEFEAGLDKIFSSIPARAHAKQAERFKTRLNAEITAKQIPEEDLETVIRDLFEGAENPSHVPVSKWLDADELDNWVNDYVRPLQETNSKLVDYMNIQRAKLGMEPIPKIGGMGPTGELRHYMPRIEDAGALWRGEGRTHRHLFEPGGLQPREIFNWRDPVTGETVAIGKTGKKTGVTQKGEQYFYKGKEVVPDYATLSEALQVAPSRRWMGSAIDALTASNMSKQGKANFLDVMVMGHEKGILKHIDEYGGPVKTAKYRPSDQFSIRVDEPTGGYGGVAVTRKIDHAEATLTFDEGNIVRDYLKQRYNIDIKGPLLDFNRLFVREQGKGGGSAVMRELIKILDANGYTVFNHVNPYGNLKMPELVKFYEKFGFEKIIDDGGSIGMIRRPQTTHVKLGEAVDIPSDWRKLEIPGLQNYAAPKIVANRLENIFQIHADPEAAIGMLQKVAQSFRRSKIGQLHGAAQATWKRGVLSMPAYHMGNLMSNLGLAYSGGGAHALAQAIDAGETIYQAGRASNKVIRGRPLSWLHDVWWRQGTIREAAEGGFNIGGGVEMRRAGQYGRPKFTEEITSKLGKPGQAIQKGIDVGSRAIDKGFEIGNLAENHAKVMVALSYLKKHVKKGKVATEADVLAAGRYAEKYLFDYVDNLTAVQRSLKTWFPFLMWTSEITKRTLKSAITEPHRLARAGRFYDYITEPYSDEEKASMSSWLADKGPVKSVMGMKPPSKSGLPSLIQTGRFIPWGQMEEMTKRNPLEFIFGQLDPYVKAIGENVLFNRSAFKGGRPIEPMAGFLEGYKGLTAPLTGGDYSLASRKTFGRSLPVAWDDLLRKVNPYSRQMALAEELLRGTGKEPGLFYDPSRPEMGGAEKAVYTLLGSKFYPYDKELSAYQKAREANRPLHVLRAALRYAAQKKDAVAVRHYQQLIDKKLKKMKEEEKAKTLAQTFQNTTGQARGKMVGP